MNDTLVDDREIKAEVFKTYDYAILFGYIFSFLGGLIGVIIAIYLFSRNDEVAKTHGKIQIAISVIIMVVLGIINVTQAMMGITY